MATKYDKDSIVVIKNDRDRVRQSPNMYIPNRSTLGSIHSYAEIWDNAFDELSIPESVGNQLDVTFDTKTRELTVTDDGRGIPHEKLYDALTVLAASGKFNNGEKSAYLASGGSFGHGVTVVLALSKTFTCTSTRGGKCLGYEFKDGLKTKELSGKAKGHGTFVSVILDPKFVDDHEITSKDIWNRLEEKSYIFPKLNVTFTVKNNGKEIKKYKFQGKGIEDRVKKWNPITDIISINETRSVTYLQSITDDKLTTEKIKINLAFSFSEDVLDGDPSDYTISYCNTIKTYDGGMHVDGLKLGIQKWFKDQVIPSFRGKDKELQILPSDMIAGLCDFTTVSLSKPEFRGQEKTQLSNPEVRSAVRDAVYDALKNAKPSVSKAIVEFVKRVTRGRMASKKTRKKDVSNAFSKDRLTKFKDIVYNLKTDDPELILVEGDSAADNAATARDPHNQAIYPIKRPANVYDLETNAVDKLKTTFNDVLDICGLNVGEKCDPSKSTMNRILLLTDGDVDGDDIAISMACLLAKHCKPLIDAGMVGRILPPAYSIPVGKGKKVYIRSQKEFFDRIIKDFIDKEEVSYKGKVMSKKDLRLFLEKNFEYDQWVDKLKDRYCCDPKLIEYIAWSYHGHAKDQKKSYWMKKLKDYSWLKILIERNDAGDVIVLDGDAPGFDYLNLALDDYFDRYIHILKEQQQRNDSIDGYSINGKSGKTVYDVMHAMRKHIPGGSVERFKGLGELQPQEMIDLCMDKDKRTVIIFSFKDFKKDMDKINVIMSTKKEFVEARSEIMYQIRANPLVIDT